jgi:hypothetical protein
MSDLYDDDGRQVGLSLDEEGMHDDRRGQKR